MVTDNHYRWDFVGLSTDDKPTPATSEKVVNGSTFYCSDTSKLYVFCKDTWYERKPLGSGGGGTTYTAGEGIDITEDTISIDEEVVATLEELNARIAKGEGAPTTATEGVVGGLYEDNTNGKLYICTGITAGTDPDPDTYTWEEVGGGGVTPVQTTGTSTTDVMSQDATTKLIYPDITNMSGSILIGTGTMSANKNLGINSNIQVNAIRYGCIGISGSPDNPAIITNANSGGSIAIGDDAYCAGGGNCVAIGTSSNATGGSSAHNVAIGYYATTNSKFNAVALGSEARCTRDGEVNISTGSNNNGYNSTPYRVIGGVHDGQLAQDAVNVDQVNGVIDAINTALSTNIPHIGAAS